ncbi:MAG: OmpA family protein [Candidatus Hydrogenedentes bacterium]|nr:OmpA family protein [Candidatus Hydrogenedentota bacterium]
MMTATSPVPESFIHGAIRRAFLLTAGIAALGCLSFTSAGQTADPFADLRTTTRGATRELRSGQPERCVAGSRGFAVVLPEAAPFVDLGAAVLFGRDSAAIREEARALLDKLGESMARGPLQGYNVQIEGHTCDLGSDEHNLELSRGRAESVRDYLVTRWEVDPGRIRIVGYGKSRPRYPNTDEENRTLNRRARFIRLEETKAGGAESMAKLEEARTRGLSRGEVGGLIACRLWGGNSGCEMAELGPGATLASEGVLQLRVDVHEGCHFYVLHKCPEGKVEYLVPAVGPENLRYGRWVDWAERLSLPDADGQNVWRLVGDCGLETLYVAASRKPLADAERLRTAVEQAGTRDAAEQAILDQASEVHAFEVHHTPAP